jgi:hypothetical protein
MAMTSCLSPASLGAWCRWCCQFLRASGGKCLTLMPCSTVGQGKLLCRLFCTVMRQLLLSSGNSHVHGIDVTWEVVTQRVRIRRERNGSG